MRRRITKRLKRPTEIPYLNALIFHAVLGFVIYLFKPLATLYFLGLFVYFIIKILQNPKDKYVILEAAAYVTAAEVFLRMTGGALLWEIGKYSVIVFMLLGMFFHGFKRKALIYVVYLLLLLPAVYITYIDLPFGMDFRTNILFNLSGPLSLAASALFCYDSTIKLSRFLKILDLMLLPIILMTVYIVFYAPDLSKVVTNADASYGASGGYGPNQVSTALGIGLFIGLVRFIMPHKNNLVQLIVLGSIPLMAMRALATLSRGGVLTALLMFIAFLGVYFWYAPIKLKSKSFAKLGLIVGAGIVVWTITVLSTGGMVARKYANEQASGVEREDITTGRVEIANAEFEIFSDQPFLGSGVGMSKVARLELVGDKAASHNEITRMISEHGLLGIIALLLLLLVPAFEFLKQPKNLFIIPLIVFWGATINHSAMRIAAPGFFYGFALLSVQFKAKRSNIKKGVKKRSLSNQNSIVSHD
ncbi:O-antigen ligase family protein [Psychroflexus sp. ALD_RP9]|uniref:O-antigen ligase family protein n=1 Tax=Psychroflexus sp. ALD_RP9 TaxID=2777186 RepID=UPI001A8DA41D|nr:O-antigen ligase family protein [Psychroflexus sp. ALD_RP9]QSS96414.1 O-antigen ligase family protein [Psychroflexus sp. ALD_RP9]